MRASHLAAYLTDTYGLSPDAAKQRVSRASPPIRKFPIRLLPKNEAFLYHQDDRNSERFWEALVRSLRESSSIYGLALDGLIARGGLAQRPSFNVVAGAPEAQKKQVPRTAHQSLDLQRRRAAGRGRRRPPWTRQLRARTPDGRRARRLEARPEGSNLYILSSVTPC